MQGLQGEDLFLSVIDVEEGVNRKLIEFHSVLQFQSDDVAI